MQELRQILKKSYPVVCAYAMAHDFRVGIKMSLGRIDSDWNGTTHLVRPVADSVAYIDQVHRDYRYYGNIDHLHGRVAEIGPGDNCGVGLLMLDEGCETIDLVDRFYCKRDPVRQKEIYRALLERRPSLKRRLVSANLSDDTSFPGIQWHYGEQAAAETFFNDKSNTYDFILSRAVLQSLYDPLTALGAMVNALRPNGVLLHKVDLSDLGMFTPNFNELKYFEVPDSLYRLMTRNSGRANRVLVNQYRDAMSRPDLDTTILVTRLAGVGVIGPHLPYAEISEALRAKSLAYVRSVKSRFAQSLRTLSDEDLSVAGIFIVSRKIGTSAKSS